MVVDWDGLETELGDGLKEVVGVILDGAKDDLKVYGQKIAKLMIAAIREGREDLREELLEASGLLLEAQRLKATKEQKKILETVLMTTFKFAVKAVSGVGL